MKLLAIEFTSEFIHIYQLDTQPGNTVINRALHLEMPKNCYVNGMIINNDRSVSDLIMNTLKEEKIREKKVVISISNVDCMLEEFSVPSAKPKHLEGMVNQELQKRRKLSNQYIYDYIITGKDPLKEGYLSIKCVLCPKALISNYYDVIKKSALTPMALDLTNHAMEFIAERSTFTSSKDFSILACVNKDEIHFIYCGRNEEPYYRHAYIKQSSMIEESMFVLSANNKFNFGNDAAESTIDTIVENITKLTRFHAQRHPDVDISTIYIYGDYEDIPVLCDRVQNTVGIKTRSYNIVGSIGDIKQRTTDIINGCINVLGTVLAMYDSRRRNYEFFEKLQESKKEKNADLLFIPSIVGVVLLLLVIASYICVKNDNDKKEKEIAKLDEFIYGGDNLERYYTLDNCLGNIDLCYEYNDRADALKNALAEKFKFGSEDVNKIIEAIPEGVTINAINYSGGTIALSCVGNNQYLPAEFASKLKSLPGVIDVNYSGFTSSIDTDGDSVYSFTVLVIIEEGGSN